MSSHPTAAAAPDELIVLCDASDAIRFVNRGLLYTQLRGDHRIRKLNDALGGALFTSIDGIPGDSGAPIVDAGARVVGLVHGGAQCHIATPSDTLRRLIADVLK